MALLKIVVSRLGLVMVLAALVACTTPSVYQSSMQAMPLYQLSDNYFDHRAQQREFASSGGKLAYLDVGQGPALLLLHGVPSSSWLYRKMIPHLQSNFRIIAPDFLGYGSSDKPAADNQNYSVEAQSAYVQELLAHLGVEKTSIVFHDMGGLVAWQILENQSEQFENIFVLNTIVGATGFNHPSMKKGFMAEQYANAFANELTSAAVLEMTFRNMGLTDEAALSEAACFGYVKPMREGANSALYEFYTGFDDALFARLERQVSGLKNFRGGMSVMWGAKDKVLTTAQIPLLEATGVLQQSNIHVFENNAHFLPEEIPVKLTQIIKAYYGFE